MKTYTSCRYLKADSSFGTMLNWFPSRYLNIETQTVQRWVSSHEMIHSDRLTIDSMMYLPSTINSNLCGVWIHSRIQHCLFSSPLTSHIIMLHNALIHFQYDEYVEIQYQYAATTVARRQVHVCEKVHPNCSCFPIRVLSWCLAFTVKVLQDVLNYLTIIELFLYWTKLTLV